MEKKTNPVKAIRAYCLNCCLESANEVKLCQAQDCALWAFRMGKNPYRAKPSEKQIEAARAMAQANFAAKHRENTDGKLPNGIEEYKNTSEVG